MADKMFVNKKNDNKTLRKVFLGKNLVLDKQMLWRSESVLETWFFWDVAQNLSG